MVLWRDSVVFALVDLLLASMAPGLALGQEAGGVEGRVVDRAGRPLPAAQVGLDRAGAPAVARAVTDSVGGWRISNLDSGWYQLTVDLPGYRTSRQRVQVESGRTARLTVVLDQLRYTLDTLLVSGHPLSAVTSGAELGTALTAGEISLLPTTLDVRDLIALTPGARPDHIWGGASDQANAYVLDGTAMNHPGLGGALFLPSPSWIDALEVRGLGAGADVGGSQGGMVEAVTLEGGDALEGGLQTSFESHRLNASNLVPGEIGSELAGRWQVDGRLRGPLARGRLHFALFGLAIGQQDQVSNYLPGRTGALVPQPPALNDYRGMAKLRWTPGPRDVVEASLLGRDQSGDRVGQTGYQAAEATQRLRAWNATASVSWQRRWSPRSALTLRLGGFAAGERYDPYGAPGTPGIELFTQVNPGQYQNAPFRTSQAPSSLGFTATWVRQGRLVGREHELKLGGEYTLGAWDFERLREGGMTWRPWRSSGFDPSVPSTWAGGGAIPTEWGGEARIDSDVRNAAVFVQESIGLLPWLRFSPGLRLGWWTGALTPADGPRFTSVRDVGLEPRIGLVAELDHGSGLVAKVHWGRYHQPMFAGLFDRAEGAGAYSDQETWSYLGPTPSSPSRTFTRAERDSLAALGLFRLEGTERLQQTGRVEGYRQPYMDQAVLSLERALGSRWKAGVALVHRRNRDMVALVDRNLAADYTVVENVLVLDRFDRPLYLRGQPLVLGRLAISNEDLLAVQELLKEGILVADPHVAIIYAPPGMSPADLAALGYDPDLVLTHVPDAKRRFVQVQLRLDARYRTWWAGAWATVSWLHGNFNVVSGPDDYTTGGPGPWVRLNEQSNFFGALDHQSQFEGRAHLGAQLPARLRGGVVFSYASGDRVTPVLLMSSLLTDFAVVAPRASDPTRADTLRLHPYLVQSLTGQRIFLQPRGAYRYEARASLDLHLERSFSPAPREVVLMADVFNLLGDRSVTGIQYTVNPAGPFGEDDYGRVRSRVAPRTLRLSAGVRF